MVLAVRAAAVDVVLLAVVGDLGLHLDGLVVAVHQVAELVALLGLEQPGHLDVAVHHQRRVLEVRRLAADLAEDLVGDGGVGLHEALAAAVPAVRVEHPADGLTDPLAGHLDQAELADAQDVGLGLVPPQGLLERLEDLVPVLRLLHVDEVADDDAADVPEPELVDDLLGGLHVDLGDRLLEALLPDVAPRVHVDGGERLGLVDDQVAAALEPHLALGGPADLLLDAVAVEDGFVRIVEHHPLGERRVLRGDEAEDALVLVALVDHQLLHVGGEEVAGGAQDEVEVRMHQARAAALLVLPDHLVPDLDQEPDVALQLRLRNVLRHRPDDEAGPWRAEPVDDLPEPPPLLLVGDPAADAHVVDRGHEDQVPAGDADVRGEPGALAADGVLRDLDHDLLAHLEQVLDADLLARLGPVLAPVPLAVAAPAAVPVPSALLLLALAELARGAALSLVGPATTVLTGRLALCCGRARRAVDRGLGPGCGGALGFVDLHRCAGREHGELG